MDLAQGMSDEVTPDWSQAALLTIDVQRDFTLPGAPVEIPGTLAVVPQIQRLAQAFRHHHKPILHVVRLYLPDGSNAELCRRSAIAQGRPLVLADSQGAELVEALKPSAQATLDAHRLLAGQLQAIGPQEWIVYKPRWGAFYRTPIEPHLQALGMTTVVLCGCNFPNCPRTSVYEASERDFRAVLIADATSGIYERGVQELRNIGVTVMTRGVPPCACTTHLMGRRGVWEFPAWDTIRDSWLPAF